MKKILATLLILLASTIASAQYPNFGGTFFTGSENLSLLLVRVDVPWSTANLVNDITLEACANGDGGIVLLEREELVIISTGDVIPLGGTEAYTWNPSAHAYVHESNGSNQGRVDVGILVFNSNTVKLLDGVVYFDGVSYVFFDVPQWEWLDIRPARTHVMDEDLY